MILDLSLGQVTTMMLNLLHAATLLLFGSTTLANQPLDLRVSMVHKNPGEGHTLTKYSDPHVVSGLGYNAMVKQDGRPPHAAITWDSFDTTIFPNGSAPRQWVEDLAEVIDNDIQQIHIAGMKAMYWFDMFVLPRTLVEKYNESIIDSQGRWSLDSDAMVNITLYMLDAVFERFPDLDGLVIRTGEIYTFDVPYHVGSSPITDGYKSHIKLLQTLEEIVIKKYNKLLLYRTWSFDGFVNDPVYYLNVTDSFEPHPNLYFVIKHTAADFWRTVKFNPTLDIGKHQYLVEIQCQREYESKGATPDYVMNGVIDGFEEEDTKGKRGMKNFVGSDKFKGVVTWARGGGWGGPYPADEYWIDMNVKVIAKWAGNPWQTEQDVFNQVYEDLDGDSLDALRQLALKSAHGVLLGHYSLVQQLTRLEWTRDNHIGGFDKDIAAESATIVANGTVDAVLREKQEALDTWDQVRALAQQIKIDDPHLREFVDHSITYAQLYYKLIATSWAVGLKGLEGNSTGHFDIDAIRTAIEQYDETLAQYNGLSQYNQTHAVSSLYVPLDSDIVSDASSYTGANHTVDMWRFVVDQDM